MLVVYSLRREEKNSFLGKMEGVSFLLACLGRGLLVSQASWID